MEDRMMRDFIVTGGSSGLGLEICNRLGMLGRHVLNVSIDEPAEGMLATAEFRQCDLSQPKDIYELCRDVLGTFGTVDCLVNCAGINHIAYLEDLTLEAWHSVMAVNAQAPFLLTQGLLPALKASQGTVLNVVSNASHMPMTASLAYNASKAALDIMTRQLARELTKRWGITVFGISPNKMHSTGMSQYIEQRVPAVRGWTPEQAAAYQKASLLTGEETDPADVAAFIAYLLSHREQHFFLSGCVLEYGV